MSEIFSIQNSAKSIDVLNVAERRLKWLERRQAVLAGNVSNANTPGYVPKDVTPFQGILKQHLAVALEQTAPNHLSGKGEEGVHTLRQQGIVSPDGNAVDIETELEKVASNNDQQRFASNTYSTYNSMFLIALGAEK